MRLSQTRADKIKSPGRYSDGRGLYLQITKAEHRSWLFRFELNGRERFMGLGPCADFTLEEARERARLARQLLKDGIDPLDAGHEQRAKRAQEAAKVITFKAAADAYYDFHSPKWENEKHKSQFRSRLSEYVFPVMGALPVAAIDKPIILKTIQPIWNTKHATAARTLGLVKSVLDYAKASGWRDGDNPAAWSGNLSNALPTHSSKNHHAALPFALAVRLRLSRYPPLGRAHVEAVALTRMPPPCPLLGEKRTCRFAAQPSSPRPSGHVLRSIQSPRLDLDGANGKRFSNFVGNCSRQCWWVGRLRCGGDATRCDQSLGIRYACRQQWRISAQPLDPGSSCRTRFGC